MNIHRWVLYSVLSVCAVIIFFVVILGVLLATLDNEDYRDILTWGIEHFTDYKVSIKGTFSLDLSMEPSLSISDILIESDEDEDGPLSAQSGYVRIKIALKPLLSGAVLIRDLDLYDAEVFYADESGSRPEQDDGTEQKETLADIDIPILESVTLQNISVSYLDKGTDYSLHVIIDMFNIDDVRDAGPLYVKGSGTVNKTEFSIDGQLGAIMDAFRHSSPYLVDLNLGIADFAFRISGTIDDPVEGKGIKIHAAADAAELSNLFSILNIDVPRVGYLDLDSDVTGDIEAPRLEDFQLKISGEPQIDLFARGSVANLLTGAETDLSLSASCSNRSLIRQVLPAELSELNDIRFESHLREKTGVYTLENIDFSVSHEKGLKGSIKGNILLNEVMEVPEIREADLKLNITSPDTKPFRQYLPERIPDTGPVTATAQLSGQGTTLSLNDIDIAIGTAEVLKIGAVGRIGSIPFYFDRPVSDIDMKLSAVSTELQPILTGLTESIREWDSISARTHITGSSDRLHFDRLTVHLEEEEGANADITGDVRMEQRQEQSPLITMDLAVSFYGQSLNSFRRLLAAKVLPDLKPAKASLRVTGTTELISLEDIVIQAGQPGPLHFEWKGQIGKVTFDSNKPVSEVEIINSFYAERTSLLSPYAGISIPDFGPIEVTSRTVARKEGYGADDIEIIIGTKENALLRATGSIDHVMRGTDVVFDGIDLSFKLRDLDSRIIAEHLQNDLLHIGKISGSLTVSGAPEDLSLTSIEFLSLSHEGLKTSIHGRVQHIRPEKDIPFQGVNIELAAEDPGMIVIKKINDMDLPNLGTMNINVHIKDRDDMLNVETFLLRTGPEKMPTLLIEGTMNDILSTDKMDSSFSFEAATKPWAEEIYGHRVPEDHRVKGRATITGSRDNLHIDGRAHSGKTEINAKVDLSREKERQRIAASISAPKIYLDDLGIYPEQREGEETAKKDKKNHREKIFSDEPYPFPKLKNVDLSFRLDTEEIVGRGFILNNFDIDVVLKDGLMLIGPARVNYADGFMSLESTLDMRGSRPELKLNLKAEDIDTADLFSYAHSPMILDGHLNLAIDLQSSGGSPREVASALNGELGIALEHGQIKQLADLLGADAIDFVTTARKMGTYQELNCLALNFKFDNGIGTSQVIYVDTPGVRSQGKGTVNLQDETVNLVIQPKPKKGQLGGSSPITIEGPLGKPSARKLPYVEAARLFGEVFMPYAFLPARAIGYVGYLMKEDKDEESPCLKSESDPELQGSTGSSPGIPKSVTWRWQGTRYKNDTSSVPSNPERYMIRFLGDGRVFIHADCNISRGNYTVNGSRLTIDITDTTGAVCPDGSLEKVFIRDLHGAANYFYENENLFLELKYDSGTMQFTR